MRRPEESTINYISIWLTFTHAATNVPVLNNDLMAIIYMLMYK